MSNDVFVPSEEILKKYADVLVKFALNSGAGVKKGEVVQVVGEDTGKPLMAACHRAILEAGGHPMIRMLPTGIDKTFFDLANEEQLMFFPKAYLKERVKLLDHSIGILAEHDLHELAKVDPAKIMRAAESKKKYRDWQEKKEYSGKFTWTLALYGTPAMAKEAGLGLREYWNQIIKACFLDMAEPIKQWQKVFKEQERIKKKLNAMPIAKLHVEARETDLWLSLGERRKWVGGSGRNIPSFELFTSPDWRGTEGKIFFNQPLYRYGNLIRDVRLEFKKGKVIKATADSGEKLLGEMIKRPNADKIGEYSLTDGRMSRITKFMANTLFDENMGGPQGNTHLAVGSSYKDAYDGDPRLVEKKTWKKLGFNDSGEHTDIIATTKRTVTAVMKDGAERMIYADGKFVV